MFTLRDYQQEAADVIINHVKKTTDSCIVEAATGAGKSMVIAHVAKTLFDISKGKRVLCLAPSSELVQQNRKKYLATGEPASMYSASAGKKCLKHPVVFGSPLTVLNSVNRLNGEFCAVIIDECDLITPTVQAIIDELKNQNKNIRVIGLTATPYRLGSGYIYKLDEKNNPVNENGYFVKKVYTVDAQYLIDRGYLTKPIIGSVNAASYDTETMQVRPSGRFKQADIDQAYKGHGRKTASIVADVISQSRNRKGVMFFAATVEHAEEIMASLPPDNSRLITGKTKKKEREKIINDYLAMKFKFLVNVSVLTVGFDAPHVDVIAMMRLTESVRLLQQIIGRMLRLADNKEDALLLDYAGNIERHCPDGDLFNPEIKESYTSKTSEPVTAVCPDCNNENEFTARPNPEGYSYSEDGYFLDLMGNKVPTDHGFIPAHMGRRCNHYSFIANTYARCGYRWTFKECPHCEEPNDIAARYCTKCRGEIIDPNEKLILEQAAIKRDPYAVKTEVVQAWSHSESLTKNGDPCVILNITMESASFRFWLLPESKSRFARANLEHCMFATKNLTVPPKTITYVKNAKTKFYDIRSYNDEIQ